MKQGFILGTFDLLHKGHERLIEAARSQCDKLMIMVCQHPEAVVPGWQRYHWVKNSWPDLEVVHCLGGAGQAVARMESHTSEEKVLFDGLGKWSSLAQNTHFQYVSWKSQMAGQGPLTGEIRDAPYDYWDQLLPLVRPMLVQRVALVGPESCGKSYLSEKLAEHFDTVFVEEYGRTYCEKFGMDSTDLDFAHVAGGQLYREDEMALQANKWLFCDTELIVTQVWSEVYFKGRCQPWIYWANHARRYVHFLLCAPDIPWVNDGLREYEKERGWMFERLKEELECRELPYTLISGSFDERWNKAVDAVKKLSELKTIAPQISSF